MINASVYRICVANFFPTSTYSLLYGKSNFITINKRNDRVENDMR